MTAPAAAQAAPVGTSTDHLPAIAAPAPSRALTLDLSVQDLLRQKRAIAEMVKEVLKEGVHYGPSFPGDDKKTLHQPGADALIVAFGLVPRFSHVREDIVVPGEGLHREYTITCTLLLRSGMEIGSGIGSCSTLESKYRWRNARPKCPDCSNDGSLIRTKGGRNPGGWWCVTDRGGCGANFNKGDRRVEGQALGKVPNPDIADTYNTILKLGAKRAKVAATILCTGCSDMFTQDLDELDAKLDEDDAGDAGTAAKDQQQAPDQTKASPAKATTAPAAAAKQQAAPAAAATDIDAQITAEYGTLQVRAGKKVALKIWQHWKETAQKPDRLAAMRKANVAIKAITDRLGQKSEQLLNDILTDRANPDDVAGILDDLQRAAAPPPPPAAAAPPAAADSDEPPF